MSLDERRQEKIQELIRKLESEIEVLIQTKRNSFPVGTIAIVLEQRILEKQETICQLRGIL